VNIPLGLLVAVTGVSGAGKSTLINQILYPALAGKLHSAMLETGRHKAIHGLAHLDKVINIDQKAIGRTPRSNPATYTKVFDFIRDFFARLPESNMRGYKKGRYSFNVKGGTVRSLPRRRLHQGGNALSGRRLRALRNLPGQALQRRHPGDQVQGPLHRRCAGPVGHAGPGSV
jgi:hypothetical protein